MPDDELVGKYLCMTVTTEEDFQESSNDGGYLQIICSSRNIL